MSVNLLPLHCGSTRLLVKQASRKGKKLPGKDVYILATDTLKRESGMVGPINLVKPS